MPRQDNIISFGSGPSRLAHSALDARARRLVDSCRQLLVKNLPQLMTGLFEQADDALYILADKSDSDVLQTTYFETMRELRKERVSIDRRFTAEILRIFDRYWETGQVEAVQRSFDELSFESEMALVNDDELEDSLAITNMVSKNENRYVRELFALNQRFAYLISGNRQVDASGLQNPLGPAVICNAFQFTLKDIPIELPVKLVVYKLFDRHVLHYLGGLYDSINLVFGNAGIIPKLTPKARHNPVAPAIRRGERATPQPYADSSLYSESVPDDGVSDGINAIQGEVFTTLQQLLNLRRSHSGDSQLASSHITHAAPGIVIPTVETNELVGALSALQQSNIIMLPQVAGQPVSSQALRDRLVRDLQMREGEETSRTLGEADNDTIDVISMLFEFILEDFSLPDAMKALLSRLQIPMLKVAIIDKSFFSRKVHPARRLLNSMAKAAIGWNDTGDRENDSLYCKIEAIVKKILNDFHDDPSIFAELNEEFSTWWQQEQRGAEIAEQRTNQVNRGKEQLRGAKQIVVQEINSRLQDLPQIPEAVMELLEEGWKDVLLLNYLRQGPESDEWKTSLEIVERLLWSIQPKTEYAERQELLRSIPELLRNLRERLNSISFDQHKMARLFKELQNCHIGCLRGGDATAVTGPGTAPAKHKQVSFPDSHMVAGNSSYLTEDNIGDTESVEDDFTRLAESIEVGTWLEMTDGNLRSRVKLSWKSNVTDAYIFVNRKGMKAMEMTRHGLAKRLREESARLIQDRGAPIMDRALDAMLDALRNSDYASTTS